MGSPKRPDELGDVTATTADYLVVTPVGGPAGRSTIASVLALGGGGGGGGVKTVNAQTGTTYTTVIGDANNIITLSNTSGITLTIPPNGSVAYAVGTTLDVIQLNTGQVTVAPGLGVTLNGTPGLKLRTRYSGCSIVQVAANSWTVHGDTTP